MSAGLSFAKMPGQAAIHIRGIDAFIQRFAGTQDPSVRLTVGQDDTDPRPGVAVYAGKAKIAVVALVGPEETKDKLMGRLQELRRRP